MMNFESIGCIRIPSFMGSNSYVLIKKKNYYHHYNNVMVTGGSKGMQKYSYLEVGINIEFGLYSNHQCYSISILILLCSLSLFTV